MLAQQHDIDLACKKILACCSNAPESSRSGYQLRCMVSIVSTLSQVPLMVHSAPL